MLILDLCSNHLVVGYARRENASATIEALNHIAYTVGKWAAALELATMYYEFACVMHWKVQDLEEQKKDEADAEAGAGMAFGAEEDAGAGAGVFALEVVAAGVSGGGNFSTDRDRDRGGCERGGDLERE